MKMPADIRGHSLRISLWQSHYEGCRSQGTGRSPAGHMAERTRIAWRIVHHRPVPISQSYPQYIDNIATLEAFGAGRQGMCRAISVSLKEIESLPNK